jgi:hypothetical protein
VREEGVAEAGGLCGGEGVGRGGVWVKVGWVEGQVLQRGAAKGQGKAGDRQRGVTSCGKSLVLESLGRTTGGISSTLKGGSECTVGRSEAGRSQK